MKNLLILFIAISLLACSSKEEYNTLGTKIPEQKELKKINPDLPIIGIMAYNGVLMTEVTAPLDVFTKKDSTGKELFNVIIIAENDATIDTEEGLKIIPDYTFENTPDVDVLFIPSAYDMFTQVQNSKIIAFIQAQNKHTKYTVSNCGGAQLIGKSGIADGKKIVTWIGGGKDLQKDYPNLIVQDDSLVSFVEDGKFMSANGNLASYISSLELLEKLSDLNHRKFVESYLYLDRLKNWEK